MNITFFLNSILLGVGLAMDAFSVSVANGISDINMKRGVKVKIAGTFAFFQFAMPVIGWFLVTRIAEKFEAFQKFIPWIALILLLIIGIDMITEGIKGEDAKDGEENKNKTENIKKQEDNKTKDDNENAASLGLMTLIIQGIATSIDALSVGFTIADYGVIMAFICALIIAVVTFIICIFGLRIGIRVGNKLSQKAAILGGSILIFIGLEIFIKGVFL